MFFDNFCELCFKKGVKPKKAATEIGLSNSITTKWKKGSVPNAETLISIADYFGVSVSDLLSEGKKTPDLKIEIGINPEYYELNSKNRAVIDRMIAELLKSQSQD